MKVILKQAVEGLGQGGDLVEVKDGYARNFLVPQGLVVAATSGNVKQIEHQRTLIKARLEEEKGLAEDLATRLAQLSLTITKRVGENDRLFGSVTNREIEEALREEGIMVPHKTIVLQEQIRSTGVYNVEIKLHTEVKTVLKVWVVPK